MNYNEIRRKTRKIKVGGVYIGGDAPVTVQSMTNTPTEDYEATLAQVRRLENAGCDIVRVTVPSEQAAKTIYRLKEAGVGVSLVADIHFDYKLALAAADAGADKIRINPGNIGGEENIKAVASKCRALGIPIRIGINSGSVEKKLLAKYGAPNAEALAASALYNVSLLEKYDFENIIIAVKSSDVQRMVSANRITAAACDYPLHLGVTEAGSDSRGTVKSAIGIGSLLLSGIGDTLRVSLTADPVLEPKRGHEILAALDMDRACKINIVSCPTCGRTKINIIGLVNSLEARLGEIKTDKKLKVAVMGCAVNGPGEASDADIGIAGGVGEGLLFKKGKIVCKIPEDCIIDRLIEEINRS